MAPGRQAEGLQGRASVRLEGAAVDVLVPVAELLPDAVACARRRGPHRSAAPDALLPAVMLEALVAHGVASAGSTIEQSVQGVARAIPR